MDFLGYAHHHLTIIDNLGLLLFRFYRNSDSITFTVALTIGERKNTKFRHVSFHIFHGSYYIFVLLQLCVTRSFTAVPFQ